MDIQGKLAQILERYPKELVEKIRGADIPDLDQLTREPLSAPEHIADRLSNFIGSWGFVLALVIVAGFWITLNTVATGLAIGQFDPPPFAMLGFVLTCVAAVATPLILISQNRQTLSDRKAAMAARHYTGLAVSEIEKGVLPRLADVERTLNEVRGLVAARAEDSIVLVELQELRKLLGKPGGPVAPHSPGH